MTDNKIDLATVIQQLRYDVEKTWWEGQGSAVAMEVGPIELEVTVQVEKSGDAKLGVKFYIVDASVGGNASMTNTQRVKIVLTPRDRHNAAAPLLISGTATEGEFVPDLPPSGQ
jgi:hypothetical protein